MGTTIQVACLGPVRVMVAGQDVRMGPDQRVLVGLLVAAGPHGLTKQQIYADLFDGEVKASGVQVAVMRLQRLRNKLAQRANGMRAITNGPNYALDVEVCHVDAWELDEAVAANDLDVLRQLARNWSAPFGNLVADPHRVVVARQRLQHHHRLAMTQLAWQLDSHHDDGLLPELLAAVSQDLADEELACATAAALYRLGRQQDGLDTLSTCRQHLLDVLGLDPQPRLAEIQGAILDHDEELLSAHRQPSDDWHDPGVEHVLPRSIRVAPPRFVGREDVLRSLGQSVDALLTGRDDRAGSAVMIVGGAGSGKTSVLAKVLAGLPRGVDKRFGRAMPTAGSGVADPYRAVLTAVPELRSAIEDLKKRFDPGAGRAKLVTQFKRCLEEIARSAPTVLVLEDLHAADSQTNALIRHVCSEPLPKGLLLLMTRRPDESPASAVPDDGVDVVRLEPLTGEDLRRLVTLDHPNEPAVVRDRFADRLPELSGGNTLVASVLSRDAPPGLDPVMLSAALTPEENLTRHLRSKISDPELEQLLSVAALVGQRFHVGMLSDFLDIDGSKVVALLEKAEAVDICENGGGGEWEFDHLLTVNHFLMQVQLLQPMLFARLARETNATGTNMVRYVMGAGTQLDPEFSIDALLSAAELLETRLGFEEAFTALQHALGLMSPDDDRRLEVLVGLASTSARAGAFADARQFREEASGVARERGDADDLCEVALSGLPAGEYAGGDADRLEILDSLDVAQLKRRPQIDVNRWIVRMARLLERPDLAEEGIRNAHANTPDQSSDQWRAFRAEELMFRSGTSEAMVIRSELEALAAACESPVLRAYILHRTVVAAITEQEAHGQAELFDRAWQAALTDGSPRTKWAMEVLRVTLNAVGLRESDAEPDMAKQSGLRWGIPDVLVTHVVQTWFWLRMNGQPDLALSLLEATKDSRDDNVAWQAGEALGAAEVGDVGRASRIGRDVIAALEANPDGTWGLVAAALLIESVSLVGSDLDVDVARMILAPRSGLAIVLGGGAAHLGPVDRYLAMAEGRAGNRTIDLTDRAREQAAHSGASVWAELC